MSKKVPGEHKATDEAPVVHRDFRTLAGKYDDGAKVLRGI